MKVDGGVGYNLVEDFETKPKPIFIPRKYGWNLWNRFKPLSQLHSLPRLDDSDEFKRRVYNFASRTVALEGFTHVPNK